MQGAESQAHSPGSPGAGVLITPTVHLIFWGSYRAGTNTAQTTPLQAAAANLLNTTYLDVTNQYTGHAGHAAGVIGQH